MPKSEANTAKAKAEAAAVLREFLHTATDEEAEDRLLRTREVAALFQVSERAVTDWGRKGRLHSIRTPGGHRRFSALTVKQYMVETGLIQKPS